MISEISFLGVGLTIKLNIAFAISTIVSSCIVGTITWILYCSRQNIWQFIKNRYEWLMWNLWIEWRSLLCFILSLIAFKVFIRMLPVALEFIKIKLQ